MGGVKQRVRIANQVQELYSTHQIIMLREAKTADFLAESRDEVARGQRWASLEKADFLTESRG